MGGSPPGLARYLRDVRRHSLLSRNEEQRTAVAFVETGEQKFAQQLVTANLRFVLKIALEYKPSRHLLHDLIQEGNVGLVHAVHKYDPRRGVKLSTYASWWIRAYLLKFILSNARLVRLGTTQAQRRLFFGLRRERARLESRDGGSIGVGQLASAFGVNEKEVVEMEKRLASIEASLDTPVRGADGDGPSRGDLLPADEGARPDVIVENIEFREALSQALATFRQTLTGRDLVIFESRLLAEETKTLAEIALQFGVSRERVRQLEGRLRTRLQNYLAQTLGDALPELPAKAAA